MHKAHHRADRRPLAIGELLGELGLVGEIFLAQRGAH
eukprot:CAMPEP_0176329204 /NCGR_PEP_ID=MMETSP0121_2-20121125/75357_1 /TAXON_ID=160619 /ORGANISM="Kryptoperidinium foliaceum, Strain CCMP 1326" /LENGTH=36 /DNA_ID= /DNA_START= /DNA_END= /DNA_ORIENTATION=